MDHTIHIEFLLNGKRRRLAVDGKKTVLSVLREHFHLMGTKEGCNEGDCGACTVALGSLEGDSVIFKAVASCILPIAKIHGKHLITIEGLGDHEHLHLIQQSIVNTHGIQCGFCSPGIILSFFALFAHNPQPSTSDIEIALQGNICRCTGYEGIRKAGELVTESLSSFSYDEQIKAIVPSYVQETKEQLTAILRCTSSSSYKIPYTIEQYDTLFQETSQSLLLSGGTDIMVQKKLKKIVHDPSYIDISSIDELKSVWEDDEYLHIGSQLSITECMEHSCILRHVPKLSAWGSLVASTQVRNVATIAGNIANASPIGDFTMILIALGASITIHSPITHQKRNQVLKEFFQGYKKVALHEGELIVSIDIPIVAKNRTRLVNFEKSSRRKDVDIATVNSASVLECDDDTILRWDIVYGGVGPVPLFVDLLSLQVPITQKSTLSHLKMLGEKVRSLSSSIDDVRGSACYREVLMKNHVIKHFLTHGNEGKWEALV